MYKTLHIAWSSAHYEDFPSSSVLECYLKKGLMLCLSTTG